MAEVYVTRRFFLRPVEDRDLAALFTNLSDPMLMQFYDVVPAREVNDVRELIARWRRWEEKGTGVRWAIARREDDRLVGTCGLHDIDRRASCAEAGCEVSREYWGRGVMQEVAPALGRHGFEVLGLNRINALVAPDNRPSLALLEHLGFRRRRRLRACRQVNGKPSDMLSWSMSRATYFAITRPGLRATLLALASAGRDTAARLVHEVGDLRPSRVR